MIRRTTIEIDEDLLLRAKQALGGQTTRATVEEALRRVANSEEHEQLIRAQLQADDLRSLTDHLDLDVLASDEMWR